MEDYGLQTKLYILELGFKEEDTSEISNTEVFIGSSYLDIYVQLRTFSRIPEYTEARLEITPDVGYYEHIMESIDTGLYLPEWSDTIVDY